MKFERNPALVNFALWLTGGWQMRKLKAACLKPRMTSAKTLRRILEYAKDTEYGKEHHFEEILKEGKSARKLFQLYQQYVPANDYENLRPYIDKQKEGEENVIIPGKPVLYATTSGTTSEPKWIPMSKKYLDSVYNKMTKCWLYNYISHKKKTFGGDVVFSVGKLVEGYAPDGTTFGSVSGLLQKTAPEFIRRMYASRPEIFSISNYQAKYYTLMRIVVERNISLLIMPNPSTILEMQKTLEEHYDEICDDIEKGTISDKYEIEADIRRDLLAGLKPNPERAKELRKLKEQHNPVLPKYYWPNLQLMSTWKCGNTKIYVDKFADWFPETVFYQELGYFSTECRFGLCLDDSNDSVLFPHFHYYEFVEESEIGAEHPHFYQLYELQRGKRYVAYVTTFGGLYRYNMNDLVEVGSMFRKTPCVHMVQKVNGIVNMTGEKLYEQQLVRAVAKAEELTEIKTKFFIGFANVQESRYEFYFEFANQEITQAQADSFTHAVDSFLQKENVEYDGKRASARLLEPLGHRLETDSYGKFKKLCVADGMRDGQFKLNLLLQDEKRREKFKKLVIKD